MRRVVIQRHHSTLELRGLLWQHRDAMQQYLSAPLPSASEIDAFCAELANSFTTNEYVVSFAPYQEHTRHIAVRHLDNQRFVVFRPLHAQPHVPAEGVFHALWQPSPFVRRAPLLVHLPGYGAGFSLFPEAQTGGYHVLHVSPLGYVTAAGRQSQLQRDGVWPVMLETVETEGLRGYRTMLQQILAATAWALQQPAVDTSAVGFFGTSQGGGLSLLMASILRDRLRSVVVAHLPFLTSFVDAPDGGSYELAKKALSYSPRPEAAAHALLHFDTLAHAHRLDMPVLLTSGGQDKLCPAASARKLFDRLPGIRALLETPSQGHVYTPEALRLTLMWFDLYL